MDFDKDVKHAGKNCLVSRERVDIERCIVQADSEADAVQIATESVDDQDWDNGDSQDNKTWASYRAEVHDA